LASLVFCDLIGSTALGERVDPESVQELLRLYFTEIRLALERHGGVVEKFIGDAVVGVFGCRRPMRMTPCGRAGPHWRCRAGSFR
jgi:class 3 adenylate cyclase